MELPTIDFKKNKIIWMLGIYYAVFLVFAILNERFYSPDFAVYYHAAKNFVSQQPVYYQQYGTSLSGIYKYSPFVLFFFIPFTFLPEVAARLLYFWILAAVLTFTLFFLEKFLATYLFQDRISARSRWVIFFSFLVTAVHFHRELELGNVNLLLLLILLIGLGFLLTDKRIPAGILIGIAVLVKPHFLIFLPWLLLRRQWKVLVIIGVTLLGGSLAPIMVSGWQGNISLHSDWLHTMAEHNSSARLVENPNTLHHWLYLLGFRQLIPEPGTLFAFGIMGVVGVLFLLFMIRSRIRMVEMKNTQLGFEFLLLLALVPSITYTDTQHFLFSLPLIMMIFIYWFHLQTSKNIIFLTTLLGFFFFGGNWYEVWRRSLSIWIEKTGFLGLGNLLIVAAAIYYFTQLYSWRGQARGDYRSKFKD